MATPRAKALQREFSVARLGKPGQSILTPGSLRMPRSKVAVNSQPCRACLATTRHSANPQEPASKRAQRRGNGFAIFEGERGLLQQASHSE